ncbi:hypothetical protein MRX96_023557 [Rhipicephalus microplus]
MEVTDLLVVGAPAPALEDRAAPRHAVLARAVISARGAELSHATQPRVQATRRAGFPDATLTHTASP